MRAADAENAGKIVIRIISTAPNVTGTCPAVTGRRAMKRPVPVDGQKSYSEKKPRNL